MGISAIKFCQRQKWWKRKWFNWLIEMISQNNELKKDI